MAITYKSQGDGVSTETSGAALSPLCPATVDAGDILIAHVYWEGTTTTPSTPANWALLSGPHVIETTISRHWVYGKIADGTEDGAAVAFGAPAVTTQRAARIYSFAGRVGGVIQDVVNGFAHQSHASDATAPSVTTTEDGNLAVLLVGQNDNNAFGNFTGESGGDYTEAVAEYTVALTPGLSLGIQTAAMATAGTITGGSDNTLNDPVGVIGFQIRQNGDTRTGLVGSLTGAGVAAVVGIGIVVLTGALAFTGVAPQVTNEAIFPGTGSAYFGLSDTALTPSTQTLTFEGQSPSQGIGTIPSIGSLTLDGVAPTVQESGGGASNTNITPTVGSLTFTGNSPEQGITITGTVGSLALTGTSSVMGLGMPGAVGSLILTGDQPTLVVPGNTNITPLVGSATFTGIAPTVTDSGSAVNTNITPGTGEVSFGDPQSPGSASLTLTGFAPGLLTPRDPLVGSLALTGLAPTVSQTQAKRWYLANATSDGWRRLSETLQAAATINDGWIVATGAVNHSEYAVGVERAALTFLNTNPPDGSLDTSLKDAFRSQGSYLGSFLSGSWDCHFVVRAVTNASGQDGRIRFRLIKADLDGSNATEITSGQQSCSLVSNLLTSTDFDSSLSFNPGAFTVTNQYLFFQLAWERTGGGSMSSADVNWRTGSSLTAGTRISSSGFIDGDTSLSVIPFVGSLTLTGIAPNVSQSSPGASTSITPSTGELFFGDAATIRPATGALQFSGSVSVGSPQVQPSAATLTFTGAQPGIAGAGITPGTAILKVQQWAKISWVANTEPDLAGYRVYRSLDGSTVLSFVDVPGGTAALSYVWNDLSYGLNYFWVTAYDTSDNESLDSATVSFNISGGGWAPTLRITLPKEGSSGALTLNGLQPTVVVSSLVVTNTNISTFNGTLTLTGIAPSIETQQYANPGVGSLALSGNQPTVVVSTISNTSIAPASATLAFVGQQPTIAAQIAPLKGSLTLDGQQPTLVQSSTQNFDIAPFGGSLEFVEFAPVVLWSYPQTGTLTLTGNAPTVTELIATVRVPIRGALSFSSSVPTVVSASQIITPVVGTLNITGISPAQGISATPNTGSLVIDGRAPEWRHGIIPSRGQLTLTSQQVPAFSFELFTSTGSLTLTGASSVLSLTLQPAVGSLAFNSDQPIAEVPGNTSLAPFAGTLTLTGQQPTQFVTITPSAAPLSIVGRQPAPPNISLTPSAGSLVLSGTASNVSNPPTVQTTPYPCYPRWNTGQTWGGHSWCAHRNTTPHTTDMLDLAIYYLSVELEQTSEADFVIAHIQPQLNINAELPDKYQAFVDRHDFERLSVEIVNGSSDDFVIQSIRPVINLRKKWRSNT